MEREPIRIIEPMSCFPKMKNSITELMYILPKMKNPIGSVVTNLYNRIGPFSDVLVFTIFKSKTTL